MSLRRPIIGLILFLVAVIACTVATVSVLRSPITGPTEGYTALFTDAYGLRSGDDVRQGGVRIGKVGDVALRGDLAEVTFTTVKGREPTSTTRLAIRYQNLLGQRYVDVVRSPSDTGRMLPRGAQIPTARTTPAFDVTGLFNGFRPIFETLQPQDVNQLAENLLRVVQGDGSGIGPIIAQIKTVASYAHDRESIIVFAIDSLGVVADRLRGQSPQLVSLSQQLSTVFAAFASKSDAILENLVKVRDGFGPLGRMLAHGAAVYDETYGPLDARFQRTVTDASQIRGVLALVPQLLQNLSVRIDSTPVGVDVRCRGGSLRLVGVGAVVLRNQRLTLCR